MLPKFFTNNLLSNLLNTAIVLVAILLIYLLIYTIFIRKIKIEKSKHRVRVRFTYFIVILALFLVAKIWVSGFTNLFYGLSFVSAGLVVTNKESIMNFVGSIIIRWRGLFAEGDYIQLDKYSGFVHELGVMYFRIFEVSETSLNRSSGRMIKVPNGLVINNPVINYSLQNNVIEYKQSWIVTPDSDIRAAKQIITDQMKAIVFQFYAEHEGYTRRMVKKNCRHLSRLIDLEIHIKSQIRFDKPSGVELLASYYCYPRDKDNLDEAMRLAVLKALNESDVVKM
ncbi:MAG: hypothetical protein A3F10_07100, partial [Coxiella sp. RIFCSPHIGHO2_12_FULL_42_15]